MSDPLAVRSPLGVVPDPARVVGQLFVPGHALVGELAGHASNVVDHVLLLSDIDLIETLDEITARFGGRHRDLAALFDHHAQRLADHIPASVELSAPRRMLLGATFTHEYAVEAAAVCNPSAVPAADQTGLDPGELRVVLSVRQIGEGHRSSIGFRTIVIGSDGDVSIGRRAAFTTAGTIEAVTLEADVFEGLPTDVDRASVRWVLDGLGPQFAALQLKERLQGLRAQEDTRRDVSGTASRMAELAARCYGVRFPASSALDERVLMAACAVERNGVEDARLVRFVDDDGSVTYHAPYTAFDGSAIAQQLLTTTDFETFTSFPLLGPGAANKGLALFPRRIDGRFHALSRFDGQRNAITVSDDLRRWPAPTPLAVVDHLWSSVQLGNCGSPIELDDGWLVLTHGVGAMRTYSIGALLLDLDDPTVVLGQTAQPLITPAPDEQDGYVPNVVYSCGAVRHGEHLVVPFGIADHRIGFATLSISEILAAMLGGGQQPTDQEVPTHA